jgi:hypothetical protein
LPVGVVLATAPRSVLSMLSPSLSDEVATLLPPAAIAGVSIGMIVLCASMLQSTMLFRTTTTILVVGLVVEVATSVVCLSRWGVVGLAWAVALVTPAVAAALLWRLGTVFGLPLRALLLRSLVWSAALAALMTAVRDNVGWYAVAAATSVVSAAFLLRGMRGAGATGEVSGEPAERDATL